MKRRTCPTCNGSGRVSDLLSAILNPANWIPFNYSATPTARCGTCNGSGRVSEAWRTFSPRWQRR